VYNLEKHFSENLSLMKKSGQSTEKSSEERDWLIEDHTPMVYHLAKKISLSFPFPIDIEDMVAYGQIGLVEASERFDPMHGGKFSTFAYYRIRGAIYDGLRKMGVITRSRTHRFAANANDVLMTESDDSAAGVEGTSGTDDEIKKVQNVIDTLIPIYFLSMDAENAPEVEDDKALTTDDFEIRDVLQKINLGLDEIKPEEADLLRKIYFKQSLMKDVASEMGVTKSWVSRLHARAIRHLQAKLREMGILEPD